MCMYMYVYQSVVWMHAWIHGCQMSTLNSRLPNPFLNLALFRLTRAWNLTNRGVFIRRYEKIERGILENQTKKDVEHEMETELTQGFLRIVELGGLKDYQHDFEFFFKVPRTKIIHGT